MTRERIPLDRGVVLKRRMRRYNDTAPFVGISWIALWDDPEKHKEWKRFSTSHPLFGKTLHLLKPIVFYTLSGKRVEVKTVTASHLDRMTPWRITATSGSRAWWISENDINWNKIN